MTAGEKLTRTVLYGLWLAGAAIILWLAWSLVRHAGPFRDAVDPETRTAGLGVETDAGTGCQYIVTPWGGIVARTGPDGRQLCGKR